MFKEKQISSKRITEIDVKRAIAELIANGQRPTLRGIRNHVGYGSLSTIQRLKENIRLSDTCDTPRPVRLTIKQEEYHTLESRIAVLESLIKSFKTSHIKPKAVSTELERKDTEIAALKIEINQLKDDNLEIYKGFSKYIERLEKQLNSAKRMITERNTKINALQMELAKIQETSSNRHTEEEFKSQLSLAKQELEAMDAECLKVSSQLCEQDQIITRLNNDLYSMYELWSEAVTHFSHTSWAKGEMALIYDQNKAKSIVLRLRQQKKGIRDICWELTSKYHLGTANGKPYSESQVYAWLKKSGKTKVQ